MNGNRKDASSAETVNTEPRRRNLRLGCAKTVDRKKIKFKKATTWTGEGAGSNTGRQQLEQAYKRGHASSGWKDNKKGKLLKRDRRIRKMQQQVQTRRGKATTINRQQWDRCTLGAGNNKGRRTIVTGNISGKTIKQKNHLPLVPPTSE